MRNNMINIKLFELLLSIHERQIQVNYSPKTHHRLPD